MTASHHFRRLGWLALLALAGALVFGLTLRVNAVKSEVRRAELKLVSLKREKMYLEVEFETRSNQQQLENWNDVDFGYVAPGPGQYLGEERQLASLGRAALPPVIEEGEGPAEVKLAAATVEPVAPLVATVRPAPRPVKKLAEREPAEQREPAAFAGRKIADASDGLPKVERVALVAAAVVDYGAAGDDLP